MIALVAPIAVAVALRLGGIAIGESMMDVAKHFGMPDTVQTRDDGQFWQWRDRGGLDREVIASDDLVVQSVLVAADPGSDAQPEEIPLLGASEAAASAALASSNATLIAQDGKSPRVWRDAGGLIALAIADGVVTSERACDAASAQVCGAPAAGAEPAVHRAPAVVDRYVPEHLPPGSGSNIILVVVDESGKPVSTRILISSGDPDVDAFEQASMQRSTFRPATCSGTPCRGVYLDIGGISR